MELLRALRAAQEEIRARLVGVHQRTGDSVELLFLDPLSPSCDPAFALSCGLPAGPPPGPPGVVKHVWHCLVRGGGAEIRNGDRIVFRAEVESNGSSPALAMVATVVAVERDDAVVALAWGRDLICANVGGGFDGGEGLALGQVLELMVRAPRPAYINRSDDAVDAEEYQTMHALQDGSVAAPAAGMHFSGWTIANIVNQRKASVARVTLHVSAGSVLPIELETVQGHRMYPERISVSVANLAEIRRAVEEGRAIVPVGTTSARVVESLYWWGVRLLLEGPPSENVRLGAAGRKSAGIRVGQWDGFRLARVAGGWGRLPGAAKSLEAVAEWANLKRTVMFPLTGHGLWA
mmetsp:Transcript_30131/g.79622  ORF Transcript_30131/g.79622 Transcript_30131/m.79622 type:complete len:349 (+) Transcript_30131:115-1161(+)